MHFKKVLFMLTAGILSTAAMAQDCNSSSKNDCPYWGAELHTLDTWMYGKFEARMQMATGNGLVSSMFLYYNDSYMGGDEPWVEVDMEVLGKDPQKFQSNIITGKAGAQITSEKKHSLGTSVDQGFHTYGMEWTPDYVRWTFDGMEIRKTDRGDAKNQVNDLGLRPQDLRFNLWSATDAGWVGEWNEGILPKYQFINWVKVYKYTPGQGENGSNFTLDWVDNFDNFDESRWGVGTWSFEKNRTWFTPENVFVKDGMMILAITKNGQSGYNGQMPVDTETDPQPPTSIRKASLGTAPAHPEYLNTFDLNGRFKGKVKK